MKSLKWLLSLSFFLIFLAGCSFSEKTTDELANTGEEFANKPAKPILISYWYSADEARDYDVYQKWCADNIRLFQDANKDIIVEKTCLSNSDQFQVKLYASIAAGDVPDIFQGWFGGRLEPIARSGSIIALDDIINSDPELKNIYVPYKLGQIDGKTYAIGNTLTTEVYFYNRELFAQNNAAVPKTYEELLILIDLFKGKGIIPVAMGNNDPWVGSIPFMFVFDRIAGPLKYEEILVRKTGYFTSPEYIQAGEIIVDMSNAGAYPDSFNIMQYDEAKKLFISGKAAMYPMGTWELANLVNAMGDNLGFFNFPDIKGGKGKAQEDWICSQDGAFSISARAQGEKREAAIKYLKYVFSKERLSELVMAGALIPAKGLDIDEKKLPKATAELYKQLNNVKYKIIPWDNLLSPSIGKEFNLAIQSIYAGNDIKEVFSNLQDIIETEWSND